MIILNQLNTRINFIEIIHLLFIIVLFLCPFCLNSQVLDSSWKDIVNSDNIVWFGTEEAQRIADNVLMYQNATGGWPKNIQVHQPISQDELDNLKLTYPNKYKSTTDNGSTILEMLFLSKVYSHNRDARIKDSFIKGLKYLLEAQYSNGGWPQYYPLRKGYYSHITYNDDSMVNIMTLLLDLINDSNKYSIKPSSELLSQIKVAFDKGVDCILKTQIIQNGVLTGWCAQHDAITLAPAKARSYELASLSGFESVKIVELLMSLNNPSSEVKNAIVSAISWFEAVKINGLREERTYNDKGKVIKKVMIPDPNAPPIWARFMDLENNAPFFCDRDGVKKSSISQIGEERRNGYKWYAKDATKIIAKYPSWKAKHLREDIPQSKSSKLYNLVVAQDGSGDYSSIQEAINNCKSFPYDRITIYIKNGTYREKIKVHEWNTNLTIIGESKDHTIITYADHFDKIAKGRNSTFHTYTLLVEADNFIARNLTIENTAGPVGQAIALSITSTQVRIDNCRLLGNQDTLYTSGLGIQYFSNCYIEGTTDFIFGNATAYFDNCQIHSKKDSYITAASTPQNAKYGFVFHQCELTSNDDVTQVYLGRPWRQYAKVVFSECILGSHIIPEGWHNWSKASAEKTAYYAEINNQGPGALPHMRVPWSHQLNKSKSKKYNIKRVLLNKSNSSEIEWYETN